MEEKTINAVFKNQDGEVIHRAEFGADIAARLHLERQILRAAGVQEGKIELINQDSGRFEEALLKGKHWKGVALVGEGESRKVVFVEANLIVKKEIAPYVRINIKDNIGSQDIPDLFSILRKAELYVDRGRAEWLVRNRPQYFSM